MDVFIIHFEPITRNLNFEKFGKKGFGQLVYQVCIATNNSYTLHMGNKAMTMEMNVQYLNVFVKENLTFSSLGFMIFLFLSVVTVAFIITKN